MIQKVYDYITRHEMIDRGDKVIIGVSGGADSICLLYVLLEIRKMLSFDIVVVHVEHGIRGEDSLLDAKYVEEVCRQNGLVFQKYSYEVKEIAKREKLSIEEAGRKIRYESFYEACKEHHCNRIAVAHNQNDNAETILLNLFRGSGLKGLSGILPKRSLIIRPLLSINRKEIEEYLHKYEIHYRTDATNFEEDYTRNRIRLHLLPFIKENINEKAMGHILQAGVHVKEADEFIEKYSRSVYEHCVVMENGKCKIELNHFSSQEKIIKAYILRNCMKELSHQLKDITSIHIDNLLELCNKEVGKEVQLPYNLVGKKGYSKLYIYHKGLEDSNIDKEQNEINEGIEVNIPGQYLVNKGNMQLSFRILNSKENQIIPEKTYTKWFDYDKIESNLLLRTRKTGDYIQINSQGGIKKLKSYYIDEKIPREERNQIPLLADGSHVIWVIGYRISQEYKITNETKNILEVKVNKGEKYVKKDKSANTRRRNK